MTITGKGPIRISRVTHRPVVHAPKGVRQAEALLSEAEVLEQLRLDPESLAALRACCSLRPPRNAAAIVAAIKTRLEFSQSKPKQAVEHSGEGGGPIVFRIEEKK